MHARLLINLKELKRRKPPSQFNFPGHGHTFRRVYRFSRTIQNLGFAWQVRPELNLTCDIDNLANEPQRRYRGIPDQLQAYNLTGTSVTFGVSGRF